MGRDHRVQARRRQGAAVLGGRDDRRAGGSGRGSASGSRHRLAVVDSRPDARRTRQGLVSETELLRMTAAKAKSAIAKRRWQAAGRIEEAGFVPAAKS